ncbi:M56 family metallopeptidase [Fulvivirgaceae bacterium BMA10]|uniref:M56 family metallopeptidase n=1 Tax=Splendidivirga corallicola TaxID=3051826 RepID=A0ABT8KMX1_9BACT|nr:M56 family metallopeptidase [Fulvivirgaceae bacterium BMA10]
MENLATSIAEYVYGLVTVDFLILLGIKSTILLVAVFLIVFRLKKFSPRILHIIWTIAFVALLAMPLIPDNLSIWKLPILDTQTEAVDDNVPTENVRDQKATVNALRDFYRDEVSSPYIVFSEQPADQSISKNGTPPAWMIWSTFIWLLGSLLLLTFLIIENIWLKLVSQTRNNFRHADWPKILNEYQKLLCINQSVRIVQSRHVSVPLTIGALKPVIILPSKAKGWTKDRLKIVLLHELAHIKRLDYTTNFVVNLVCLIYWFNPVIWFAAYLQRIERERACDDIVLENEVSPVYYAKQIVEIAEENNRSGQSFVKRQVAMSKHHDLKNRIVSILQRNECPPLSNRSKAILTTCFVFLLTGLTSFNFSGEETAAFSNDAANVPVSAFISNLKHDDPLIRLEAAQELNRVYNKQIIKPLLVALEREKNPEIVESIILALGKFGMDRTFYTIASKWNHPDPNVQAAVLLSLGQISCFPSYLLIEESKKSNHPGVREVAIKVLQKVNHKKLKRSIHDFANIMQTGDLSRRKSVARSLSQIHGSDIISHLARLYSNQSVASTQIVGNRLKRMARANDFSSLQHVVISSSEE